MYPRLLKDMDKTAYCRDKCASSADMLSCASDCLGRPASVKKAQSALASVGSKVKAVAPKLVAIADTDAKKKAIGGAIVAVVVVKPSWECSQDQSLRPWRRPTGP